MNLKEIREIINLMNENDLMEIEVEREGVKLKIKRASTDFVEAVPRPAIEYRVASPAATPAAPPALPAEAGKTAAKSITSPMVGTFYRSPSPESPPFIDVGQIVEVGQVVCIVEAMKLMNEIKSEIRGKILEVKTNNAEPVEFGQILFTVEAL